MRRERLNRITGYALSRPEAYIIVVLVFVAVVVAMVTGWSAWVVVLSLAAGAALLALLIIDALADPYVERAAAIADIEADRVRDPALRNKVRQALEYVRAAHRLAQRDNSGALDVVESELPQMEQAARSIYQMSLRLQDFRADSLVQRDVVDLEKKRHRGGLSQDQEAQLGSLKRLEELAHSAEQEIDSALAHLGRSYAEMQAIKVTPELRGPAEEAFEELGESTKRLADLAQGYDEAYGRRPQAGESPTRR